MWSDFGPSNPASLYSTPSSPRGRIERSHNEVGASRTCSSHMIFSFPFPMEQANPFQPRDLSHSPSIWSKLDQFQPHGLLIPLPYGLSPMAHEVHTPEAGKRFWSHCQLQKEKKKSIEKTNKNITDSTPNPCLKDLGQNL